MISDTLTFTLAFATVFIGIGLYLLKLDRDASRLDFRLQVLEQAAETKSSDATAKNSDE